MECNDLHKVQGCPYRVTELTQTIYGSATTNSDSVYKIKAVPSNILWKPLTKNEEIEDRIKELKESQNLDWNEIFQSLVEYYPSTPFEVEWRQNSLNKVVELFVQEVTPQAMAIIEAELQNKVYPYEKIQLGCAGGTKFIHDGKLFKLIGRDTVKHIYEGDFIAALKVPKREILAINQILALNMCDIHLPLTVVVQYACFSIVVSALIPIDGTTLVYGSNDGGQTVKDENEMFRQKMEQIGQLLNLKKHRAGNTDKHLIGPVDMEGHVTKDGRMYLLDTARLFPPEQSELNHNQSWLYRHLHPNLVKNWQESLNSDAFSPFENSRERLLSRQSINAAVEHLKNFCVANYVRDTEDFVIDISHSKRIKESLHKRGINLRYIGIIYNQLMLNKQAKLNLLVEVIARTIKYDFIESQWEDLNKTSTTISAELYFQQLTNTCFWKSLEPKIHSKFGVLLTDDLLATLRMLSDDIGQTIISLLEIFCQLSGIEIDNHHIAIPFQLDCCMFQLLQSFTICIKPVIVPIYISKPPTIADLESRLHLQLLLFGTHESRVVDTIVNLSTAYREKNELGKAELLLAASKYNFSHLCLLLESTNLLIARNRYEDALELCNNVILSKISDIFGERSEEVVLLMRLIVRVHHDLGDFKAAATLAEEILTIQEDISTLRTAIHLLLHIHAFDKATLFLEKAKTIVINSLNNMHPIYAQLLETEAQVRFNQHKYPEAIKLYLTVLELKSKIYGDKHSATFNAMHNLALCYFEIGDYKKALAYATEVCRLKEIMYGHDSPLIAVTMAVVADIYGKLGIHEKQRSLTEAALKIHIKAFGEEHPNSLRMRDKIASSFSKQGQHNEALKIYQQVLKRYNDTFESEHPELITTMSNIAIVFYDKKEYDEALSRFQQVHKLRKKVLGLEHPDTIVTMRMIARCHNGRGEYDEALQRLHLVLNLETRKAILPAKTLFWIARTLSDKGQYDEALKQLQQVLELEKDVFGLQNDNTFFTLSHIAFIYFKKKQYGDSLLRYQQVHELRADILGPKHPDTLVTMNNIAHVYDKMQEYDEALSRFQQVHKLRKEVLGPEHPDTIDTMDSLANCYSSLDKLDDSVVCYTRVLDLELITHGYDRSNTCVKLFNIAARYQERHNYLLALSVYLEVYEQQKKLLGLNHTDTLKTIHQIAYVYGKEGQYDESLVWYQQVLELRTEVLGPEHSDTLTTMHNIAYTYGEKGRYTESFKLYQQVLELQANVLGPIHLDAVLTKSNIARSYCETGQYTKALQSHKHILEVRGIILGTEHTDTFATMYNIAYTYGEKGEYDESLLWYEQVLDYETRTLGLKHPDTLITMYNIAYIYRKKARYDKTHELLRQVLERETNVLGPEHLNTLKTIQSIGQCHYKQKAYSQAAGLYQQVIDILHNTNRAYHPESLRAMSQLAKCASKTEDDWKWQNYFKQTVDLHSTILGQEHPGTLFTQSYYLYRKFLIEKTDELIEQLKKIYAKLLTIFVVGHIEFTKVQRRIVRCIIISISQPE